MTKTGEFIRSFGIVILVLFVICVLCIGIYPSYGQQSDELEFTLDIASATVPLPNIFRPNIDLSGRGFHRDSIWPQQIAASAAIDEWQKAVGFKGLYRIQYNFWEISQFTKNKNLQNSLLGNYEKIIGNINEAGGTVILDIFGTPAGLGKVLDKRSLPQNLKAFKDLIKRHIRHLSCDKKYNIWYEVWSAPDLEDFFLGRKQEYLNLYRAIAEAVKELEAETKIHIPLGGPSTSWWFQNFDGNTIVTPERSLIYELIQFCHRNRLPLDFISWHGFSSDPQAEKQATIYNKFSVSLVRDWLTYFRFDKNTPLIVDEWNYDRGINVLPERKEESFIAASYIPARLRNMREAGLSYQLYFSLEDFQNNKEGVIRNTGIFWFDSESSEYKGGPKASYNTFRMLGLLGDNLFLSSDKFKDEFCGVIATQGKDSVALLIYNYIDPEAVIGYLSRVLGSLKSAERKALLNLIKTDRLDRIMQGQLEPSRLALTGKTRAVLKKAKELSDRAAKFKSASRNLKLGIKNLKENYLYQRYLVDSSCSSNCKFIPAEEKEIHPAADLYEEILTLAPYSVNLIILKPKPREPEAVAPQAPAQVTDAAQPAEKTSDTTAATQVKKE